jgi:hypothetical protein
MLFENYYNSMGICFSKECEHNYDYKYGRMFCKKCGKQKDLPSGQPIQKTPTLSIPTEDELFGNVPSTQIQCSNTYAQKWEKTPEMPKAAININIVEIPKVREETINLSNKAIEKDEKGEYQEALVLYSQSIEKLDILIAKDDNPFYQDLYNKKRNEYNERALMISERIALKN